MRNTSLSKLDAAELEDKLAVEEDRWWERIEVNFGLPPWVLRVLDLKSVAEKLKNRAEEVN